ncbi:MAG TPA: hypothetical protein VFK13_13060 [Gemmatimonadaceae bacterium]|nr:hypothetical protein [Gemmatimonadaceae bacterium]
MAIPGELIPIVAIISGAVMAIAYPLVRAYSRRLEQRGSTGSLAAADAARLERMEQAIDAIAVEVERIAEGQRFTTKLLSERGSDRSPPSTG